MAELQIASQIYVSRAVMATNIDAVYLANGADTTYTVPDGVKFIVLAANSPVWLRRNAVAAIPGAAVTDGTAPMYIASSYEFEVSPGDVLHFIRAVAATTIVTLMRYGA